MKEVISALSSMENLMVVRAVIPVLAIIAIGMMIGRWDACQHEKTLTRLIHHIFLPCLVFSSIHKHAADIAEVALIGGAACFLVIGMLPSALVLGKFSGRPERDTYTPILFMSSSAVLLPLSMMLYGNEGLAKAVYFHLSVQLLLHTVGVYLVSRRTAVKQFLINPAFHALLLGVAVNVFPFQMPESSLEFVWLIEKGIDIIAQGALPVLLISFGYPMSRMKVVNVTGGIPAGVLRIVAAPALAFLLVYLYRTSGMLPMGKGYDLLSYLDARTTEAVIVLASAMPASLAAYWLNLQQGLPVERSSAIFACAAAGAVITVPSTLFLINSVIFGA